MFWRGAKERAQRAEVLEITRRLVTTWAPDEIAVIDVVADPFVAGRPVLADGDGQEFGPEFFSAVSLALTVLAVAAKAHGVRLRSTIPVDPDLAPTIERLVCHAVGRPVPPGPGPMCGPTPTVWERRIGRVLAQNFTSWVECVDLCGLAGLDRSHLSVQEAPLAFWVEVLATLRARGACEELRALLHLAWERRPEVATLATMRDNVRVLC